MRTPEPEFHRPVAVAQIGAAGLVREVTARPEECTALARRMRLPAVAALACRFELRAAPGGVVLAEGHLVARIVQECVITLEPFEATLDERFRVRFVPEADGGAEAEAMLDPDSEDEIAYRGAAIDLGEAAAEQLALALDPYPRAPGAMLPPEAAGPEEARGTAAFAALARRAPRR